MNIICKNEYILKPTATASHKGVFSVGYECVSWIKARGVSHTTFSSYSKREDEWKNENERYYLFQIVNLQ